MFGAHQEKCDVLMRHVSISRVHAAFLIDAELGVVIIDLSSKAGTRIDEISLQVCIPELIKNGSKIIFGLSTRVYEVSIDYSKM